MRAFVLAALFASASAVKLNSEWPSVARCGEGNNTTHPPLQRNLMKFFLAEGPSCSNLAVDAHRACI